MKISIGTIIVFITLGTACSVCGPAAAQSTSGYGNPFSYAYQGASLTLGGRGGDLGSVSAYGRGDRLGSQGYYRPRADDDIGSRTWSSREITSGHSDPIYRATDMR